jgi:serine/threonine-protein kinase HipA
MPLNNTEQLFTFPNLPELTYKYLPAMLADALPDDFGNALIDRYMASKGIAHTQITSLDRLAYMGNRAMGALEFKPAHGPITHIASALEMNTLVTEARNVIQGNIVDHNELSAALRSIIDVGTSAGGARAKAVIAWNHNTNEIRSGQVDTPVGFEHWLLKFDGMGIDKELGNSQDYGRIEYAYYLMARAAGITISESRLLQENDRAHFMTKRFDRESNNIKHHMQTLCAMNHMDYKKKYTNSYEQLFLTMRELKLDHDMIVEAFRRMIFNIISRNCDDHSKNFAFILKQGQPWALAPAYDLTFAYNPNGEWTNQHLMSVNNKFYDITRQDILTIARQYEIGNAAAIIKDIEAAISEWPIFAAQAGIAQNIIDKIHLLHCKI